MFDNIDTPAILVDIDTVKSNISKFQNHCNGQGLKLRPHIKTHKIPKFAKWQIEAGAVGITCQKVSEAEAIISEGEIKDILITYNIIGDKKLGRLHNLSKKVKLSVVADSVQCRLCLTVFQQLQCLLSTLALCKVANCCIVTGRLQFHCCQ